MARQLPGLSGIELDVAQMLNPADVSSRCQEQPMIFCLGF
jgi:hypothetical protein